MTADTAPAWDGVLAEVTTAIEALAPPPEVADVLARVREEEREACAMLADRCHPRGHEGTDGAYNRGVNTGTMHARADISAAIRARGAGMSDVAINAAIRKALEVAAQAACESTSGPFEFMAPEGQAAWRDQSAAAIAAFLRALPEGSRADCHPIRMHATQLAAEVERAAGGGA